MKGLDTSILLGLLNGDPLVRTTLHRLREVELATTEANLLELALLASREKAERRHRRSALQQLRNRLTVLPLDARGGERALRQLKDGQPLPPPLVLGMLSAFDSAGCDELLTRGDCEGWGKWGFKITRVGHKSAK